MMRGYPMAAWLALGVVAFDAGCHPPNSKILEAAKLAAWHSTHSLCGPKSFQIEQHVYGESHPRGNKKHPFDRTKVRRSRYLVKACGNKVRLFYRVDCHYDLRWRCFAMSGKFDPKAYSAFIRWRSRVVIERAFQMQFNGARVCVLPTPVKKGKKNQVIRSPRVKIDIVYEAVGFIVARCGKRGMRIGFVTNIHCDANRYSLCSIKPLTIIEPDDQVRGPVTHTRYCRRGYRAEGRSFQGARYLECATQKNNLP